IAAGSLMAMETSYTHLRKSLSSILDRVVDDQEVVIVRRRGARDVALVPADELAGMMETAHPLRSPRNARRLLTALRRAELGKGKPTTVDQLRRGTGVERAARKRQAVLHDEFRDDLRHWIKSDRSIAIRILDLVEAIFARSVS